MNFTREPIIETVITPREGHKLLVRSSKGNGQEDYYVDAVEVVSFGHSFFFRSLERPKSFLVPVSDYEILELRETRMVLKNVPTERSLKIGGGRESAPPRQQPREPEMEESEPQGASAEGVSQQGGTPEQRNDRKRDRRRRGRRGGRDRGMEMQGENRSQVSPQNEPPITEGTEILEEQESVLVSENETNKPAPSFISKLFPPPPTLIKETLSRYKTTESIESEVFPEDLQQKESLDEPLFEPQKDEDASDDESKFEE